MYDETYDVILTILIVGIPMLLFIIFIRYLNKKYEKKYTEEEKRILAMYDFDNDFNNPSLGGIEDQFLGYTRTPRERLGE